jgi:hypothetical protein
MAWQDACSPAKQRCGCPAGGHIAMHGSQGLQLRFVPSSERVLRGSAAAVLKRSQRKACEALVLLRALIMVTGVGVPLDPNL